MGGNSSKLKKTEKQLEISQTNVATLQTNNQILLTRLEASKQKNAEFEIKISQFRKANVKNVKLLKNLKFNGKQNVPH